MDEEPIQQPHQGGQSKQSSKKPSVEKFSEKEKKEVIVESSEKETRLVK